MFATIFNWMWLYNPISIPQYNINWLFHIGLHSNKHQTMSKFSITKWWSILFIKISFSACYPIFSKRYTSKRTYCVGCTGLIWPLLRLSFMDCKRGYLPWPHFPTKSSKAKSQTIAPPYPLAFNQSTWFEVHVILYNRYKWRNLWVYYFLQVKCVYTIAR